MKKILNPEVKKAFNRVMSRELLEEWCKEYTKAQGDKCPECSCELRHLCFEGYSFFWSSSERGFDGWSGIWAKFTKAEKFLPLYIEEPKEKEKFIDIDSWHKSFEDAFWAGENIIDKLNQRAEEWLERRNKK